MGKKLKKNEKIKKIVVKKGGKGCKKGCKDRGKGWKN